MINIKELLEQMTVDEKIGQPCRSSMGRIYIYLRSIIKQKDLGVRSHERTPFCVRRYIEENMAGYIYKLEILCYTN